MYVYNILLFSLTTVVPDTIKHRVVTDIYIFLLLYCTVKRYFNVYRVHHTTPKSERVLPCVFTQCYCYVLYCYCDNNVCARARVFILWFSPMFVERSALRAGLDDSICFVGIASRPGHMNIHHKRITVAHGLTRLQGTEEDGYEE